MARHVTVSRLKQAVRTRVAQRLDPDTTGGRTARAGLQFYRDGVNAARRFERTLANSAADVSYTHWKQGHLGAIPRERLRSAVNASANTVPVEFVVLDGSENSAATRSATAQTWKHTTTACVERSRLDDHLASGDPRRMVILLSPDDVVDPDLACLVADKLWAHPQLKAIIFDRELHTASGVEPRFVPEWSPELLYSANPGGRAVAVRSDVLAAAVLGVESQVDLAWSALLRADLEQGDVARIPLILLSESTGHRGSPPLGDVAEAARRRGLPVDAATLDSGGDVRLRWTKSDAPAVSVIVPSRHNRPLLEVLLPSLASTDYPDWELVMVDNSGQDDDKTAWYDAALEGFDSTVLWWTEEFNYSAVNNAAVSISRGRVIVFLNDDTQIRSPEWLWELVSWTQSPQTGTVGVRLIGADGKIQHGGVVVGMSGFADHLFAGLPPVADTMFGRTTWYRTVSANTAACVAIRRDLFDEIGGFDERFELLGSDVVLGLDCGLSGYRNVVTAAIEIDHLESTTRGDAVPVPDMYTSYWRYQRLLRTGDPYYSPSLSLESPKVALKRSIDRLPIDRVGEALGRQFTVFRQSASEDEALMLARMCEIPDDVLDSVRVQHEALEGPRRVETVNWFIPDIDNPFYGGVATILRIADHLARFHGVTNRFICWAGPNEAWVRSALRAIFPRIGDSEIHFHNGSPTAGFDGIPDCDAAIATQWPTAYMLANYPGAARKFYLIQDFEPMFHPAGTMYALAEETYKIGLYGICNTTSMQRFYREDYGGTAMAFMPSVDTEVFHSNGRVDRASGDPISVFLYARPGHWRNCWELVSLALDDLKAKYGEQLRIMTAGAWARPEDLGRGIDHLGLLDYRSTGDLYRSADIGISLTVSPHPSYLPVELMACGAAVVAFDLPPGGWILRDGDSAVLARRTVPSLVRAVSSLIDDPAYRRRIQTGGQALVRQHHSDWDRSLSRIHHFLSDPERFADTTS